jgi:hypothetical protein
VDDIKRHYGIYRGVVQDNKDPQSQRRLRLSIPQTTGSEVTDWAWPVDPSSVSPAVPVIGQGVWVAFIGGDPEYPIWMGTFGTNQGKNKKLSLKPLDNTVSLTSISSYLITVTNPDGTTEVDVTASLIAMAQKLANHETRIHTLEITPDIDPR